MGHDNRNTVRVSISPRAILRAVGVPKSTGSGYLVGEVSQGADYGWLVYYPAAPSHYAMILPRGVSRSVDQRKVAAALTAAGIDAASPPQYDPSSPWPSRADEDARLRAAMDDAGVTLADVERADKDMLDHDDNH